MNLAAALRDRRHFMWDRLRLARETGALAPLVSRAVFRAYARRTSETVAFRAIPLPAPLGDVPPSAARQRPKGPMSDEVQQPRAPRGLPNCEMAAARVGDIPPNAPVVG